MYYATSEDNFQKYSNEYLANNSGDGYSSEPAIEDAMRDAGFEEMAVAANLKRLGARSVWIRSTSNDEQIVQVIFEK